jgi:hypothetical protein
MPNMPMLVVSGLAAAALAGGAIAAQPTSHVMDVPLADGSVVHVQYAGEVAPKVTIEPSTLSGPGIAWAPMRLPSFAGFDRMIEEMNRRTAEMMRRARQMPRQPVAPGLNVASYGTMPAGANSVSVVSVSNGGGTCTRITEVVSQGAGKPPKVTSNVSGDCAAHGAPAENGPGAGALDHT